MKKVLCIFRAACYSPGMVERDEAILRAVAKRLECAGYMVSLVHEEDFTSAMPIPDIVLHMARSSRVLDILQTWQEIGCRVINSVNGVRSIERAALAEFCAMQGILTPKTWIVNTECYDLIARTTDGQIEAISFPCWVKRAGDCAQQSDDVCRVSDAVEYSQCLTRFYARGIARAVVMEHLEGHCVKFYSVQGTGFFYWIDADKLGYDKFSGSSSAVNGDVCEASDRELSLNLQCVMHKSPLEIYGGDVIIDSNGVAHLIDLNDWPSFSVCREEAAEAIVRLIKNVFFDHQP